MKIVTNEEVFSILMRRLNDIAFSVPREKGEKILHIISQLENLYYFPNDIRIEEAYLEGDVYGE